MRTSVLSPLDTIEPALNEEIMGRSVYYSNARFKPFNTYSFNTYLESGIWKCSKSKTGAHYFVLDSVGNGKCRHCRKKHRPLESTDSWKIRNLRN